jgi:hypothetical protein
MPYKIKANETGTVDFLGVFVKGEDHFFTDAEIENFVAMKGVPLDSALPDGFKLEKVSQKAVDDGKVAQQEKAIAEQEKAVNAFAAQAQPEQPVVEEKQKEA